MYSKEARHALLFLYKLFHIKLKRYIIIKFNRFLISIESYSTLWKWIYAYNGRLETCKQVIHLSKSLPLDPENSIFNIATITCYDLCNTSLNNIRYSSKNKANCHKFTPPHVQLVANPLSSPWFYIHSKTGTLIHRQYIRTIPSTVFRYKRRNESALVFLCYQEVYALSLF